MSAPNLTLSVEPSEGLSVVYGALAAKTSNDPPNGQLSLVLTITNNEPSQIHLNKVTVSFIGPPNVNPSSIIVDLTIPSAQSKKWYFPTANNIILPMPAPGSLKLGLSCDGFSDPADFDMPLAQYKSPASEGGYHFPAENVDLKPGEYWVGKSAAHGNAGDGTQLFAYDLLVKAHDPISGTWLTSPPMADKTLNESYYAWGKPVFAMADGVVVQFKDGMQDNTPPGFPAPPPFPFEGNHFYIQHGDDLAGYSHLQAGTMNPTLKSGPNPDGTGATVVRGQLLGFTGNSGRSSEPHLHLQVNRATIPWSGPPRPLPFKNMNVLELSVVDPETWPPTSNAPWTAVSAQGLPSVESAIWVGKLISGKATPVKWLGTAAMTWLILIGGLMITPGGIDCIICGPMLTKAVGISTIALGVLGLASRALANR